MCRLTVAFLVTFSLHKRKHRQQTSFSQNQQNFITYWILYLPLPGWHLDLDGCYQRWSIWRGFARRGMGMLALFSPLNTSQPNQLWCYQREDLRNYIIDLFQERVPWSDWTGVLVLLTHYMKGVEQWTTRISVKTSEINKPGQLPEYPCSEISKAVEFSHTR